MFDVHDHTRAGIDVSFVCIAVKPDSPFGVLYRISVAFRFLMLKHGNASKID